MSPHDFEALWSSITPKLFGYLMNTLRDRDRAEDIFQDTWLKAVEALPRLEAGRRHNLPAWLFAIARNECRDHWRKAGRETPLDLDRHDRAGGGEEQMQDALLAEQVLTKLSEGDREILRLRYIADLPFTDIAHVLNINQVAARVRVHRALARARAALTA